MDTETGKKFLNMIQELDEIITMDLEYSNKEKANLKYLYIIGIGIFISIVLYAKIVEKDSIYRSVTTEYQNGNVRSTPYKLKGLDYKNSNDWYEIIEYGLARDAFKNEDYEDAYYHLDHISKSEEVVPLYCATLFCLGQMYWEEEKYDISLNRYKELLNILDKNLLNIDNVLSREVIADMRNISNYYSGKYSYMEGDYQAAIDYLSSVSYMDSDKVLEQAKDALWSDITISSAMPIEEVYDSKYSRYPVNLSKVTESSYIVHSQYDKHGKNAFDGDDTSNWQEGIEDGPGIDEYIEVTFDEGIELQFISFKLGNWRSDDLYYENNSPKTLEIILDGHSFTRTFNRNAGQEYAILLSDPMEIQNAKFVIKDVYYGTVYNDTVITDIGFYGE